MNLQPGEATVVEAEARTYSGGSWAFTNPSFYLQNMFDDDGNTSSYLAGRNNGTTADKWISVAMRLPAGTPPIVACDVYGNNGAWNAGNRRTVAYSVMGSYDGIALSASCPASAGATQLRNVSGVRVAAGATLRATGTVVLDRLDAPVDEAGRPAVVTDGMALLFR